jgi:hypothetical protein
MATTGSKTVIVRPDLEIDIFQDRLVLNSGRSAMGDRLSEHDEVRIATALINALGERVPPFLFAWTCPHP